MPTAIELIEHALERLGAKPGMEVRDGQSQLAHLLSDCIEGSVPGAFEAPTGLGKSLAALIPAIAHALANNKRVIVATYTNVLTEQYWRKDLPLALSLFDEAPSTQLLIGRQRYACLAEIEKIDRRLFVSTVQAGGLGIESQFREASKMPARDFANLWRAIATPPACTGRFCDHYQDCFYYKARRAAEKASIVITNHSVVIQDAVLKGVTEGDVSMLGEYDYLILDEAHDFHSAAQNGLEFELSEKRLQQHMGLVVKVFEELGNVASRSGEGTQWENAISAASAEVEKATATLHQMWADLGSSRIVASSPETLQTHHAVKRLQLPETDQRPHLTTALLAQTTDHFVKTARRLLSPENQSVSAVMRDGANEQVHNYLLYLEDFSYGCKAFSHPKGTAISYFGGYAAAPILRTDIVDLAEPLQELLWSKKSAACMSATLAIDGGFEFLERAIGFKAEFQEVLQSPFDFPANMAAYTPPKNRVPDPTLARQGDFEAEYFGAIARELEAIITLLQGRTLALFHSRREMDEVKKRIRLPDHLPIITQSTSGVASVGEQFKKNHRASLFGLRSFWTGFDAPGETLSCVAVVRIPFEVPIEPLQISRQAWIALQGRDGFAEWTIPSAKMIVRQGIGRLIRRQGDRGLIALLDPRLKTKNYGESFFENLPLGVTMYEDAADALGSLGIDFSQMEPVG